MVTSNSGEGRSRESKIYTVDNRRTSDRTSHKENRQGEHNTERKNGRDGKKNEGRENYRGGKREEHKKGGPNSYNKNRSRTTTHGGYTSPYSKDKDEDTRTNHKPKGTQKEVKKEQQPDKIEIKNRIAKEKKAIQKKQAENNRKGNRSMRPQVRPKRSNNVDWTREYENDSYDDDDLDIYL